jgi:hypothetical protein
MKFTILAVALSAAFAQEPKIQIERRVMTAPIAKEHSVFFFANGGDYIKDAPYSADTITEMVQTLADGNRIKTANKSSFARDSQGRTRRDTEIQNFGPLGSSKEPAVSTFIDDPVAKTAYTLDARSKVAYKSPRPELGNTRWFTKSDEDGKKVVEDVVIERVAGGHPVGQPSVNISINATPGVRVGRGIPDTMIRSHLPEGAGEDLGERNFEGVIAKGKRHVMKIAAGEMGNEREIEVVTETWFSDQLKTAVYTKHSDPRFGETTTRLTNIKLGEPPSSLFDVPAGYKIESVSNMRMPIPAIVRD